MAVPSDSSTAPGSGWLRFANVVALIGMVTVNALANSLPLNGISTGEVSDRYPTLFTPASFAFGIWGLIYLLLTGFVVWQALPSQRDNVMLGRISYLFMLSCLLNVSWLVAWHYLLIELSLALMVGLLLTLIAISTRLAVDGQGARPVGRFLVRLPFSVYLGWITVATIANVSIVLVKAGFDGGGAAPLITMAVMAVACAIGLTALRLRSDVPFSLVLVWSFGAIAVARYSQTPSVAVAAVLAGVLLLAVAVVELLRGRSPSAP